MIRRLGKLLMALAVVLIVVATAWWVMFFRSLLGGNVKQASECFYRTTRACELGNLAGFLSDVPVYSPWAFWSAVSVFVLGLLVFGLSESPPGDGRR